MAGPPPPAPVSLLGRHRLLAPSASVRVSPLSLGGMSLGNKWAPMMGECTKETAFELLDTYYDRGGNFIDTANGYQGGDSEEWIGEWMEKKGRRGEIVLSTKYALSLMTGHPVQQSNYGGTGTKSMHASVETSLRRLRTSYIDILYVHAWDYATSIPELMQSLNHLVQRGSALYLGISNAPAWMVSKANEYARSHGLRQFSVYQGRISAGARDLEREIIPMCNEEGMAIHAWGVVGNGYFQAPGSDASRNTPFILTGREKQVSAALDVVAKRRNVPVQSVAIAYVMSKAPYIFPVIGGRKIAHLKSNIEALGLELTPGDIADIGKGYDFDLGYPNSFLGLGKVPQAPQDVNILLSLGYFDYVQDRQPVKPHHGELTAPWVN